MKSTLKERIIEAMKGPPTVSGVQLARACGISTASVSGWKTGTSKTIEGSNLIAAAKCLRVRPEWLANGIGIKWADSSPQGQYLINDTVVPYPPPKASSDKWIIEATMILKKLKPSQREGAVAALRSYVQNLGPPRHGHTLPMAAKKEGTA